MLFQHKHFLRLHSDFVDKLKFWNIALQLSIHTTLIIFWNELFTCLQLEWNSLFQFKSLNWKWRQRGFPYCPFRFMLLIVCKIHFKTILLHLFSKAELFQFVLSVAPKYCGHIAYLHQKSFQNDMYLQSMSMV